MTTDLIAAAHSTGSTGVLFGAWLAFGFAAIDQLRRMNRRHEVKGNWQHDAEDGE